MSPVTAVVAGIALSGITLGLAHHLLHDWALVFALVFGIEHALVYAASILDLAKEAMRHKAARRSNEEEHDPWVW
jgi:alcohol dehydrogenase class IV